MEMIGFLILFPLVVAALLLIFRQNKVRNAIVWVASIVIMGASIAFVAMNIGTPGQYFLFESVVVDWASIAISVIVGAIVIFYSVKYRRFWVLALRPSSLSARSSSSSDARTISYAPAVFMLIRSRSS